MESVAVVKFDTGVHCHIEIDEDCLPHGTETAFSAAGVQIMERAWFHGVQHGTATHFWDSGPKFRMELWHDGALEGSQITYAPIFGSPPLIIRKYKAGVKHGLGLWYFAGTSNLYAAVPWKNGVRQGLATLYWPDQTSRAKVWYAKDRACLVVQRADETAIDELDSLM
jgi:antitoxin component YwqK of YwqJK toxin-antitoxin module